MCAALAPGRVILVGAGPGDPELLTLRAHRALAEARGVLHDALVSPEILSIAANATMVDVGKIGGGRRVEQDEIHRLLYDYARAGRDVVRLKGGDSFVFGRGGEEALFLHERGIEVEVVPGITSSIAAPAYAGIPVTHRGVSTHFTVITGHPMEGGEEELRLSWGRAAQLGGTIVILMGLRNLAEIMETMMANGLAADRPVAVIQDGTRPTQRVVTATAATVSDEVRRAGLRAPAIVVVGDVVSLSGMLSPDAFHPYAAAVRAAS